MDNLSQKASRLPLVRAAGLSLTLCLILVMSSACARVAAKKTAVSQPNSPAVQNRVTAAEDAITAVDDPVAAPLSKPDQPHPGAETPDQAVLSDLRGRVEVMDKSKQWNTAQAGSALTAGMRVRTGALSSARLVFYDGSQASLGPQTELAIDQLHALQPGQTRVIVLSQASGQSEHQVVANTQKDSRYEVHTRAATGTAHGTQFTVTVRPDQGALFSVLDGEVSVSGKDSAVTVETGQATTVNLDEDPVDPAYFFTGQGPVAYIGETWVVAGLALTPHPATIIIGNPQVGDMVFFEGRLQLDNTRLVDLIVLLERSPENRFSLTGTVTAMDDTFWTVNGQQIAVTDITWIEAGIQLGDLVQVDGLVLSGGTLQAETIHRLQAAPGTPFSFLGVVQETGTSAWKISDIQIAVTSTTTISVGLAPGDLVHVSGWILPSGVWQASSILRALDETRSFEFSGPIESMSPWKVGGISFETRDWTDIEAGLQVGDQVRVKGVILQDGTWVAYEIRKLEDLTQVHIVLIGMVTNMDPWVVSGVTLIVDGETIIAPEIHLGMLVRVEIQVLPDGTWKVLRIDPLDGWEWANGCRMLTAVVVNMTRHRVQLEGWPALLLGENAEIIGELQVHSIVMVQICMSEDGTLQIIYIYLILQPPEVEPPESELPGGKVAICHKPSKNAHTIVVSQSAVPAHLGHGDTLGPCP